MTEVVVTGADQLVKLSRRLNEAGNKGLARELDRGIRKAAEPLRRALPQSARSTLPRRGGLAGKVAASKIRVARRDSRRGGGLRLTVSNAYELRKMDDPGEVRHPVRGNRKVWVRQQVTPGWFTKPTEAAAPRFRREAQQGMDAVARQIEGRP